MKLFKATLATIVMSFNAPALAQSLSLPSETVDACGTFQVRFDGVPPTSSAHGNWIAIATAGSPASSITYRFTYLPDASRGSIRLSTRGLIPMQKYEVRLYLDWDATHSYEIADKQSFTVIPRSSCRMAMFTRVVPNTPAGESIAFSYQGLKNVSSNWVALARPGANNPIFLKSQRLSGGHGEGTIDTTGLEPGTYELRLFEDWDGTHEYFIHASANVSVQ